MKNLKVTIPIVIGLVLCLYVAGLVHMPFAQRERASESLNNYLNTFGIIDAKSTCNKDSDGDGYASCSYITDKGIKNLECDSSLFLNTNSCKTPKNMFN